MNRLLKKVLTVFSLLIVFLIDDVLIFLLLQDIFDWHVPVVLLTVGGGVVVAMNLGLAILVYRIMQKRPTTGRSGMIGKIGVVIKAINGEGRVRIGGEIWKAESAEEIRVGEKVIVEKVQGLSLNVSRLDHD